MKVNDYSGKFILFLRGRDLKNTLERRIILDAVLEQSGHFRIEDIIRKVESASVPVSRATVYRTMTLIEESGIILSIKNESGERYFELEHFHHDHLICERCSAIIEFFNSDLEQLQQKICEEHGFQLKRHVMQLYGLCSKCREQMAAEEAVTDSLEEEREDA